VRFTSFLLNYFPQMEIIDLIILIPLIYGAWKGFKKGFVMELFTILALLVGLYAAFHFSDKITEFMVGKTHEKPKYLPAIAFLILFLAVGAMVYFGGKALEQILKIAQLSFLNKGTGALIGILKWGYLVGCLFVFIQSIDTNEKFITRKNKENALLYTAVTGLVSYTIPGVTNTRVFDFIDSKEKSKETKLTVEQVIEAKEIADSLGIDANDAKTLLEIHEKYAK
jgi:membrane protein required for colicin V production